MKNSKLLCLAAMVITSAIFIYMFWDIIMLFFFAALTAYLLSPFVNFIMKKTKVKRPVAAAVVILLLLGIIVTTISVSVPALSGQITSLVSDITRWAPSFEKTIGSFIESLKELNLPDAVPGYIEDIISEADSMISSFLRNLLSGIVGFTTQVMDIVVFFILIAYYLLDGPKLISAIYAKLPSKIEEKAREIAEKADDITWKYLKSKIIISVFTSIVTYFGLAFFGLKYAFAFSVLTFFLNFIPYFGSLIAGVVPIFYALITAGLGKAFAVLILILVIQQIEGNIISPKIQGDISGIHPVTVIFSILVCNKIWGPVGMFISVPITAIVKMVFSELYDYVVSDLKSEDGSETADSK